ncbi:MAG: Gfo/Idh/MocA family protein [Gemmataceae bacterium]
MAELPKLRVGMVGAGMIFEETYLPLLFRLQREPLFDSQTGPVHVQLAAIGTRTGARAARHISKFASSPLNLFGADSILRLLANVDVVCIATPDHRHFEVAEEAISAGKHVLIEKPSVLSLSQLDVLTDLAERNKVLAKVVYHKLFDPDHMKLRTYVANHVLRHVNNGFCSLLEPKAISHEQFSEWISGRNPATYVAVHYLKLIDFTFGPTWKLARIAATGQRGQVGPSDGPTWDAVQLRVTYAYEDGREATFDIHTDWVTPDNYPGSVEQEVQFRFDNGVWNSHGRKRGVECVVEDQLSPPVRLTPNNHYSASVLEPWDVRGHRGYGLEAVERFFSEVAYVEFGGAATSRHERRREMSQLIHNDLSADRNVVAAVMACEAILQDQLVGFPGSMVVNRPDGVVLLRAGNPAEVSLYPHPV